MPTWSVDPTQVTSIPSNRVQTAPELSSLLIAGDTVQFKKDYYHDGNGTNGFIKSFLELDNLTITSYGSGAMPMLDARIWLAPGSGGWTLVKTTSGYKIYRKLVVSTATQAVRRIWLGARNRGNVIGQRDAGAGMGRQPNDGGTGSGLPYDMPDAYGVADETAVLALFEAAYAAQGRMWVSLKGSAASDRVLYMIVPSLSASDTPDNYYNGIALLQEGTGTTIGAASPRGLRFRNCATVTIDGLNISGAASAVQLADNTTKASSAFTVQNCYLTYWWSRGVQVSGGGSFGNSNIVIQDNNLDAKPTADEQDLLTGAGWFHSAESIEVLSSSASAPCTNIRIRRNYLDGLQHNAINVATFSDDITPLGTISDLIIEKNTVVAQDFESDVRGCAVHGVSGTGSYIRLNVFKNLCCESEFSGNIIVEGNWWLGTRISYSQPTLSTAARLGPNGNRNSLTTALVFRHNWMLGCAETPIRILAGKEDIPAGGITVTRNILQMSGTITTAWNIRNNFTGSGFDFDVGAIVLTNNHIERASEPVILWRTTTSGAQTSQPVSATLSGTGSSSIVYTGNTFGTRMSPIPSTVYPPTLQLSMFN